MEQVKHNEEFRSKVIEEINSCRKDPQSYAEKVRKYATYFKGKVLKIPEQIPIMTTEGVQAFEEAAKVLDNLDSLDPLKYCPGLTHIAHDALLDIQKLEDVDQLGDLNIDTYIDKHGEVVGYFAQAVDFGSSIPELVVINLLVDDGDLNRGNRSNIINNKYKLIGVSTGNHPVYHTSTVVMYARHFYGLNEKPGNLSDDNYEDEKKAEKDKNKKLNIVKKTSLRKIDKNDDPEKGKYVYANKKVVENENDQAEDFDLPEGCIKVERQEKLVTENGVKKKVIKLIKHKDDGSIETEIFKELIK